VSNEALFPEFGQFYFSIARFLSNKLALLQYAGSQHRYSYYGSHSVKMEDCKVLALWCDGLLSHNKANNSVAVSWSNPVGEY